MKYGRKSTLAAALAPVLLLGVAACGSSGGTSTTSAAEQSAPGSSSALTPQHGGSLTVLEDAGFAGNWPAGLDPATNTTGGSNISQSQAIFGGLFLLEADSDGSNARVVPNQAASGTVSKDGKTITVKLRPGIKFSDGTPLNAKAVIWNWERDTGSSCTCAPEWQVRKKQPFTAPDPLTVQVHLTQPNAALLHNFPGSSVNWIASPTAFRKMGEKKFRVAPVGAGPFTVVSDKLSSELVLKANPHYFKKDLPYLDTLTFQSIGGDQAAYQALLAGQADAYEGASTPPVTNQAQSNPKLQVTVQPGTSPYVIQVNTMRPPFNNKTAREAMYYATDWKAIAAGLFNGEPTVVQGFTTPADLFYHQKTPGYRTYDLTKAKQLVKQVGGLSFQLDTVAVYTAKQVSTALQTQWEKAGMHVTIKTFQFANLLKRYNSGKWTVDLGTTGAWDPAAGVGLAVRFGSRSPFSGVHDPQLDTLLQQGAGTVDPAKRDQIYQTIAKYMSDHAYGSFGFAFGPAQYAVKGVHGPGLTTKIPALAVNLGVLWGRVWKQS